MKIKMTRGIVYGILITVAIFWFSDFILHFVGVGETNYYYIIKLANVVLFAFIWFGLFDSKSHVKRFIFAVVFGTWISFFYIVSSYSGLVQWLGVYARYAAPPFVVFGKSLPSFFWWVFHILAFYIGLEVAGLVERN